jgi:hypothetical protein
MLTPRRNHYVQAMRHGERWSATLREGWLWTCRSFDASSLSEFAGHEAPITGKIQTFWERITGLTSGETALSTSQVEDIFVAYLLGAAFPVPFSD